MSQELELKIFQVFLKVVPYLFLLLFSSIPFPCFLLLLSFPFLSSPPPFFFLPFSSSSSFSLLLTFLSFSSPFRSFPFLSFPFLSSPTPNSYSMSHIEKEVLCTSLHLNLLPFLSSETSFSLLLNLSVPFLEVPFLSFPSPFKNLSFPLRYNLTYDASAWMGTLETTWKPWKAALGEHPSTHPCTIFKPTESGFALRINEI